MRKQRKNEHIENYLKTEYKGNTLLSDVYIEHDSLPNLALDEIDTKLTFLGKNIDFPLMINAMTGGTELSAAINEDLASLAKEFQLPMAVGSQRIALDDEEVFGSFSIVRDILPKGHVVVGNIDAAVNADCLQRASDMLDCDAMQLHMNTVQELVMEEGDRDFRGVIDNIAHLARSYEKPLILKEVGFGVSAQVANQVAEAGITHMDISGSGGTNFIEIEDLRNFEKDYTDLYTWGIPTAKSIIDCRRAQPDMFLIASGGVKTSLDVVKSLVIGADMVAISGELLNYLIRGGYDSAEAYLDQLISKTRMIMLMLGAKDLEALKAVPYKVTGRLKELLS